MIEVIDACSSKKDESLPRQTCAQEVLNILRKQETVYQEALVGLIITFIVSHVSLWAGGVTSLIFCALVGWNLRSAKARIKYLTEQYKLP